MTRDSTPPREPPPPQLREILRIDIVRFLRFFVCPPPAPPSPFSTSIFEKRGSLPRFSKRTGGGAVTIKEPAEMRVAIHGREETGGKLVTGDALDGSAKVAQE